MHSAVEKIDICNTHISFCNFPCGPHPDSEETLCKRRSAMSHKVQLDDCWSRPVGTKFIFGGGAETECKRSEQKQGSGGLLPGKFFITMPFRSLENAPFLENLPLTEAKDRLWLLQPFSLTKSTNFSKLFSDGPVGVLAFQALKTRLC